MGGADKGTLLYCIHVRHYSGEFGGKDISDVILTASAPPIHLGGASAHETVQ